MWCEFINQPSPQTQALFALHPIFLLSPPTTHAVAAVGVRGTGFRLRNAQLRLRWRGLALWVLSNRCKRCWSAGSEDLLHCTTCPQARSAFGVVLAVGRTGFGACTTGFVADLLEGR